MYLTQLDTSTLSNQNISSALLAHTFTNTTRKRKVYVSVDLDQIAGNGDYVVYATIQRAGEGSAFRAQPSTTATVASGVTAITFASIALVVGATDVVKVYVVGLAGDTTTPDITTYINEEYIATDSSGRVDLVDAPNTTAITAIQSGLSTLTAAGVRTAVGLASANLDTQIDALPTANENADALLDRTAGVETSFTLRQSLRLILAMAAGKLSISGNTVTIRDVNDSKNRIVATTDTDGQRTAVTRDVS